MSISWDDYQPFDPGVHGPLHELPRPVAREAFDRLMAARPARIDALRGLLKANGVELDSSDHAVRELGSWFRANVEGDPDNPGRLRPLWYSVVNDVALFLGDLMIARCPGLRWQFFTGGKSDLAYQRHVIMGFARVPNRRYNVDVDAAVAAYAHSVVAGREVRDDEFVDWLRGAEEKC